MLKFFLVLWLGFMADAAHAQIGWTLDQCRKHWGREGKDSVEVLDPGGKTYEFGKEDGIRVDVALDGQDRVKDVFYMSPGNSVWNSLPSMLDIPAILAIEKGVIWERDPDMGYTSRHEYFLGKKDEVAVFHARYFSGKIGESLQVLPIDSPLDPPPVSKIDADWAIANAARIEAEKKAKAAAGPTKEELESAAHDAEIRANNERALKAASSGQ
jgi:hypothetical protein